jgi:hypothetical protein
MKFLTDEYFIPKILTLSENNLGNQKSKSNDMKEAFKLTFYFALVIFSSISFTNCHNGKPRENATDSILTDEKPDTSNKTIAIFYQMMLPSEISTIFEKTGASYNPDILNPLENRANYTTNAKAALNLGIYGVDLGYVKIFNQSQKSIKYFSEIHDLSQQLGIPEDYFVEGIGYFQKKLTNRDSITTIANQIYNSTHVYLQKNERPETAALIVLGGWVEALYISTMILKDDKSNAEITKRIAGQKYSLNSLNSYLNNYRSDMSVSKYLLMLKVLKKSFDNVNIMFDENSMAMDTINKIIHSDSYKVNISQQSLTDICKIIGGIRAEIIN